MTRRIEIYDTTLRDGTQGEGFNLSLQDKVLIAQKLDELGVERTEVKDGALPGSRVVIFRDPDNIQVECYYAP